MSVYLMLKLKKLTMTSDAKTVTDYIKEVSETSKAVLERTQLNLRRILAK
jgi:hypothetical protein